METEDEWKWEDGDKSRRREPKVSGDLPGTDKVEVICVHLCFNGRNKRCVVQPAGLLVLHSVYFGERPRVGVMILELQLLS